MSGYAHRSSCFCHALLVVFDACLCDGPGARFGRFLPGPGPGRQGAPPKSRPGGGHEHLAAFLPGGRQAHAQRQHGAVCSGTTDAQWRALGAGAVHLSARCHLAQSAPEGAGGGGYPWRRTLGALPDPALDPARAADALQCALALCAPAQPGRPVAGCAHAHQCPRGGPQPQLPHAQLGQGGGSLLEGPHPQRPAPLPRPQVTVRAGKPLAA